MKPLLKYPIYVISKGRADCCLTANFLIKDKTPFKIVIEPQEKEAYTAKYGEDRLLILPFSNLGKGSIPARNWVWEHSKAAGHQRHWILDDNSRCTRRRFKGKRIPCDSNIALKTCEDFTDRYENIAISGLCYTMFQTPYLAPFTLNCHVYSCLLIDNNLEQRWRGRYNEDTDLCLQVLAAGLCTVLINAFSIEKMVTMSMKGGNMDKLYKGDGRLQMARSLERVWPKVVETDRRFQRPQHVIKNAWRNFDTKLIRKKDIDFSKFKKVDEYQMKLKQVKPIKSKRIQKILNETNRIH